MSRSINNEQTSWLRSLLSSVWFKMGIFIVLFLVVITLLLGLTENRVQSRQVEFLQDAVRRAAVQSYALEGRFPEDLNYLEENYGLIIDHKRFAVYYESMGDNLLPQIMVVPFNN